MYPAKILASQVLLGAVLLFFDARAPPTPPPTAPAIMTLASAMPNQNVGLAMPHIVLLCFWRDDMRVEWIAGSGDCWYGVVGSDIE